MGEEKMIGKRTRDLIKWDEEYIIHPYNPVGHNAGTRLFICPPYIITLKESDAMLDILFSVLSAVEPS